MLKKAIQFNLISDAYNNAVLTAVGASTSQTPLEVSASVAESVMNDNPSVTDDVALTELALTNLFGQLGYTQI